MNGNRGQKERASIHLYLKKALGCEHFLLFEFLKSDNVLSGNTGHYSQMKVNFLSLVGKKYFVKLFPFFIFYFYLLGQADLFSRMA